MATEKEIKLMYPLETAEGGRLESVTLKRLTVADLEAMNKCETELGSLVCLVARAAGLQMDTVRKMDTQDFHAIAEVVQVFLEDGQGTGAK